MKSKVDRCIFCDEVPCACNKASKKSRMSSGRSSVVKKSTVKKSTVQRQNVEPSTIDALERLSAEQSQQPEKNLTRLSAMRSAALNAPAVEEPQKRRGRALATTSGLTDEDLLFYAAIRALAPLLHPDERKKYAAIITSEPDPRESAIQWEAGREAASERLAEWKKRRDAATTQ